MTDDKLTTEELLAALGGARVVLWFCPKTDDDQHRAAYANREPTVEWTTDEQTLTRARTMTPTCLVCGEKGEPRP